MYRKQYQNWFSYLLVLCIGYIPLTACSKEPSRDQKDGFSYTLSFDSKGMPVVLDAKGNPVPPIRVEGAVDAKKIVRVRNFSVIDVEGSHFILFQINGTMYRFNLPH
mgnify:CR=1 FL=1